MQRTKRFGSGRRARSRRGATRRTTDPADDLDLVVAWPEEPREYDGRGRRT